MKAVVVATTWPLPRYKRFANGLKAIGYEVTHKPGPGDLLVIWNRYKANHELALQYEQEGKPVIVAENPYIKRDSAGRTYTALALHGHNGSGRHRSGDAQRWRAMEMRVWPWQGGGDWILLASQRGIGAPGMAMPETFLNRAEEMLRDLTGMHVERREPPSRTQGQVPLDQLWPKIHACVVWTSNVATEALMAGVPAFYMGPHHIMEHAAEHGVENILHPKKRERLSAFERLAWAQWTDDEIEKGRAFKWLLS